MLESISRFVCASAGVSANTGTAKRTHATAAPANSGTSDKCKQWWSVSVLIQASLAFSEVRKLPKNSQMTRGLFIVSEPGVRVLQKHRACSPEIRQRARDGRKVAHWELAYKLLPCGSYHSQIWSIQLRFADVGVALDEGSMQG